MKVQELFEAVAGPFKRFKKGQVVTVKKTGEKVEVISQNEIGLVFTAAKDAVKVPADKRIKIVPGKGYKEYMPSELQEAKVAESYGDVQKRADHFTNSLSAKLKAKGFNRDRGGLWKDSKGNVISIEIDLSDDDGWINWATGQMRGAKPRFNESGNDPLSSASEVSQALLSFATESYKD